MNYKGKKIGFKRTVGAISELSKLAPDGRIDRLDEVFRQDNLGLTVENGSKLLAILNKWYEKAKAFEDAEYKPEPIPAEWFMMLDMDEYTELLKCEMFTGKRC